MSSPDARWSARSAELHTRVRAFMVDPGGDDFDALACAIADHQRASEPIARLWQHDGVTAVSRAADIPAVFTDAFRLRRIAVHPPQADVRVFRTSGTTAATTGQHALATLATYRCGALMHAEAMLWPDWSESERRAFSLVALVPRESDAPQSSLSYMVARFADGFGQASWHVDADMQLDAKALVARLDALQTPALVAGTSFAFIHLLDHLAGGSNGHALSLPVGSRLMPTGGTKGRVRAVDAEDLRAQLSTALGVPPEGVVGEYGMTELSSQLYQCGLVTPDAEDLRPYRPPHWLRVTATDPETLAPLPAGSLGLARFVDLANVDSAVAVQTADLVRVGDDGHVWLEGRAPGATPRGCSLALEHLVDA